MCFMLSPATSLKETKTSTSVPSEIAVPFAYNPDSPISSRYRPAHSFSAGINSFAARTAAEPGPASTAYFSTTDVTYSDAKSRLTLAELMHAPEQGKATDEPRFPILVHLRPRPR